MNKKVTIRKYHKQQVLDVLQAIQHAQQENDLQVAQEGVEALLDFIDNLYNEDTEIANLLAKHFELLYKLSICEVDKEHLNKSFDLIKNTIINDFQPNHIEVVFLLHLASCSDSLETIYLAAQQDPDCDAYWIPLPYYARDENFAFSFESRKYEGQEHYPNIQCTSYEEYDIAERRPDAIFTFFMYERNHGINLLDDYLCENLKNLTDMLVSVPYYVDIEEFSPNFHFGHPCYEHVHKAIIATEKQRNLIVKTLCEKLDKDNTMETKKILDKRFVTLGSPKYDKVLNTTRENSKLPESYANLIKDKKVILYITSVSSIGFYSYDDDEIYFYFANMIEILEYFISRDDVVLWFRPHPLMQVPMTEEVKEAYMTFIKDRKLNSSFIYDDTADLHRAIAWSDALYGDWSSITLLYQVTGKPIMINRNTRGDLLEGLKPSLDKLGGIRYENENDTLDNFIEYVLKTDSINYKPTIEANAGKNIYEYIKNLLIH